MFKAKKIVKIALSFIAIFFLFNGCGTGRSARNSITVKGSDTMVLLGQRWAEQYMEEKPGVIVQVTGGGSGTGIAALINGSTNICQASRSMKEDEKAQVKAKQNKDVVEIPVAVDGIAVYVNESNPIKEISLSELKAIYTGKILKWKEFGGEDKQIIKYGRENNSGTYMYFKEHVLENGDFVPEVQTLPGTSAVVNAVAKDKRAIGYGGIAYAKGVKPLKVKRDKNSPAIEPNLQNIVKGKYPISRHLYFYTAGEPQGKVKEFIDWVLGEEGQKICEHVGYYPLPKQKR